MESDSIVTSWFMARVLEHPEWIYNPPCCHDERFSWRRLALLAGARRIGSTQHDARTPPEHLRRSRLSRIARRVGAAASSMSS